VEGLRAHPEVAGGGALIDPGAIALLVTAILGSGGIASFFARRKAGAEAESIAAATLIAVNEELRRELSRRDEEIARLRERVAVLEAASV
jgi:hypothetical protein